MSEPTAQDSRTGGAGPAHDRTGEQQPDESRDVSDVGLPHPGDDAGVRPGTRGDDATGGAVAGDEEALDEVFPAEDR